MSIFKRIVKSIRPGLNVSDEVFGVDFSFEVASYFMCLLRGRFCRVYGLRNNCAFIGRGVRLNFPSKIVIGRYSKVGDYSILSGLGKSGLSIGDRSSIGAFSRIVVSTSYSAPGEFIRIGDNVGIGEYSSIGGSGGVEIGNDTIIAQYFSAHPENHDFRDVDRPIRLQGTTRQPIKIGQGCWIGSKVTVLAGVTIGDGVVVGAGSVVTKNIPSGAIAVGNPAKVVKFRGE